MITIRPVRIEDTEELYAVVSANKEHLTNLVWASSATRLSTEKFIATNSLKEKLRTILLDGKIVGMITLRPILYRQWMIGYWLDHRVRGKGYMREAVRQIIDEVPGEVITAHIHPGNHPSKRILTKSGFYFHHSYDDWEVYMYGGDTK